jgi:hypothetical protein
MYDLDMILRTLSISDMPEMISQRIKETMDSFFAGGIDVSDHQKFNERISEFVRQIYGNALMFPRMLKSDAVLAEAINLLDQYYESPGGRGYDAAYLEAVDKPGKGIEHVLRELADFMKSREITHWLNSFYLSNIDPIDKNLHLEIVKSLLGKYFNHLPDSIRERNPASFIKYYRNLIDLVVSSEKFSGQLASSGRNIGPN